MIFPCLLFQVKRYNFLTRAKIQLTPYHANYFAYELTKQCSSNSIGKLAASLSDAQVDLNPHQVEAVLFAFPPPSQRTQFLLMR